MLGNLLLKNDDKGYQVAVRESLQQKDISSLFKGELTAIVIPNFYDRTLCAKVADKFINHPDHGTYNALGHAPDVANVGRVGISYFEACNCPKLVSDYHQKAVAMTHQLRSVFDPYYSPIDRLRVEFQEVWPAGANLEMLNGQKMFVGLCRTVAPNKEFLPHQDFLERDAQTSIEAKSLQGQIACNIYLHVDAEGGELDLWAEDYNEAEYDAIRLPDSYGMDRAKMAPPTSTIKPGAGDLILFNSRRPHAVRASHNTYRMSVSCFIGYRGEHMPLTFWS